MTKHIGVQRRLHRFAYLIIQIILCYWLGLTHAIQSLYYSSLSPAPELNTGNIALTETIWEATQLAGERNSFTSQFMYRNIFCVHCTCSVS